MSNLLISTFAQATCQSRCSRKCLGHLEQRIQRLMHNDSQDADGRTWLRSRGARYELASWAYLLQSSCFRRTACVLWVEGSRTICFRCKKLCTEGDRNLNTLTAKLWLILAALTDTGSNNHTSIRMLTPSLLAPFLRSLPLIFKYATGSKAAFDFAISGACCSTFHVDMAKKDVDTMIFTWHHLATQKVRKWPAGRSVANCPS